MKGWIDEMRRRWGGSKYFKIQFQQINIKKLKIKINVLTKI